MARRLGRKEKTNGNNEKAKRVGRVGIKRKAHGFIDNFWNKLRVDKGFTMKDIAEYLHLSPSYVSRIFSGQVMPPEEYVNQLCDLFDIDPLQGEREFRIAHKEWDISDIHGGNKKTEPYTSDKSIKNNIKEDEKDIVDDVQEEPVMEKKDEKRLDKDQILRSVYGKLDYDEFVTFTKLLVNNNDPKAIKKILYGLLDFELYDKVSTILE